MARSSWNMSSLLSTTVVIALSLVGGVSATLDPIVIKGQKFFYKTNGTQFFIKGVAYQSGGLSGNTSSSDLDFTDPLADATTCKRDIPYLQRLNTNVIRTYALDPTADHSECMAALDAAGIYVISDLSEPGLSINRADPAWDVALYQRYTAVIDDMQQYTNTLGFFAGNEVTNNISYTPASAFVKAAVRDMKSYISEKNYRPMGVGYATADDATVRLNVANYFNCGDAAEGIDFWGYNIYSWCGDSSYTISGYDQRVAEFANYSVPVFFAEYGCNTQGGGAAGRMFTEVGTLFSSPMDEVFSGGIVYEYFEDPANDYGLVTIDSGSVSTMADFNAYSTQIHSVSPSATNSASYTPTNTVGQACPTVDAEWQVDPSALPPTPDAALCDCMVSSLKCQAVSSIDPENVGTLFSQVCGYNGGRPCAGILKNTTTGVYGAYSMCNSTQQLSYAFNAYYLQEGNAQACDFGGNAQTVKANAASSCSSIIAAASGTLSPTGTNSANPSAATSTKKGAAGAVTVGASLDIGLFCTVAYVSALLLSGAGILLL